MKQVISVTTLAALLNLTLVGCERRVTVQLYETGQLRHDRITGVVDSSGWFPASSAPV